MSKKVRVAIIGVGNCASSFVQGLEYYKNADPNDFVPGLMHVNLGGYHISDIEISAAFDIDKEKVGKDVSEAIFSGLNNTVKFSDVPKLNIPVQRGMTHDGLGKYLSEVITKAPGSTVDIAQVLKDTGTDVVVNYLPVGSEAATRWYTEQILEAPCAMVNCMPVFIAREDYWQARFRKAGVPIIGDDIKSQVGATIVHRVLTHLFQERGVEIQNTYQLNFGGNTDFLNMLERERLMSKKISKTNSVQSQLETPLAEGPHPHRSVRLRAVAQRPQVGVHPPRGQVVRRRTAQRRDEARGARLAEQRRDRHRRGALLQARTRPRPQRHPRGTSSYFMKSPPRQVSDYEAHRATEEFIAGLRDRAARTNGRAAEVLAEPRRRNPPHPHELIAERTGADSVDAGRRRGAQGARALARGAGANAALLRLPRGRDAGRSAPAAGLVLAWRSRR